MDKQNVYLREKRVQFTVEYQKHGVWFTWESLPTLKDARFEASFVRSGAANLAGGEGYPLRIVRQDVVTTSYLVEEAAV